MYKNKRFFGVIPARGGSKGIPRKNIKNFAGKPLISWTIEAAAQSSLLDGFVVSTEDEEIAHISRSLNATVLHRPDELATDEARGIDVAIHALKDAILKGEQYDYCLILQPTSPMRTADDINACITKAGDTCADSVMSMYEVSDMAPEKLKRLDDDKILPLIGSEGATTSDRKAGIKIYKRNCAVYLTKTEVLLRGELFGEDSRAYVMPADRSIDINDQVDFDFAEFLLAKQTEQQKEVV